MRLSEMNNLAFVEVLDLICTNTEQRRKATMDLCLMRVAIERHARPHLWAPAFTAEQVDELYGRGSFTANVYAEAIRRYEELPYA